MLKQMDNSFENGHYLHVDEHEEEEDVEDVETDDDEPENQNTHAFKVFRLF